MFGIRSRAAARWATTQLAPDRPGGPQPSSWANQQADIYTIDITFDQPVVADVSDFVLTNLGVNAPVDADAAITLTPGHLIVNGNTVTLDFGGLNATSRQLPNGVYRLEILPTLTNTAGQGLDGDGDGQSGGSYLIEGNGAQQAGGNGLARLDAEWNGDLQVSIFDFNILVYSLEMFQESRCLRSLEDLPDMLVQAIHLGEQPVVIQRQMFLQNPVDVERKE